MKYPLSRTGNRPLSRIPWYNDPRSKKFSHAVFFGFASRPTTLNRPRKTIKDQGLTQECAPTAASSNGQLIHGIPMSAEWQTSKVSRLQGFDVTTQGSNPNQAMNSQLYSRKGGYLPQSDWKVLVPPESLDDEASNYGDSGYLKPDGGIDIYDGICNALAMAYNQTTQRGAAIQAFSSWDTTFDVAHITQIGTIRGYHSFLIDDYDDVTQTIRIENSWGNQFGDGGYQTMTREVVNKLFARSNTSLKIPKPLTWEQIALAKQEGPWARVQRMIIDCWYQLTLIYAQLAHR